MQTKVVLFKITVLQSLKAAATEHQPSPASINNISQTLSLGPLSSYQRV